MKKIVSHRELDVYKLAFDAAMKAEAWRKRRYEAAFVSKLCDCEGEAAEVQTWLEFSVKCEYLERSEAKALYVTYDQIIGKLVTMINHPKPGLLHDPKK